MAGDLNTSFAPKSPEGDLFSLVLNSLFAIYQFIDKIIYLGHLYLNINLH